MTYHDIPARRQRAHAGLEPAARRPLPAGAPRGRDARAGGGRRRGAAPPRPHGRRLLQLRRRVPGSLYR